MKKIEETKINFIWKLYTIIGVKIIYAHFKATLNLNFHNYDNYKTLKQDCQAINSLIKNI